MNGPESSKEFLHPKEPSAERAKAAADRVMHFRDAHGHDLPVAARLVDGRVVMQIGLNPCVEMVLTPHGAATLGDALKSLSGYADDFLSAQRCGACGHGPQGEALIRPLYQESFFHRDCWRRQVARDQEAANAE